MRNTLRHFGLLLLVLLSGHWASAQNNMGINVTGAAPNVKSLLDIDVSGLPAAGKRGMLIPRMTYAQRLAIAGLTNTDQGLWVYQTNDSIASPVISAGSHGYWYFDGVNWRRWSASNHGWRLTGNGNTNGVTHFLGTVAGSADDLHIRTTTAGAQPQILIDATNGNVAINPTAAGVERLDINGGARVGNTLLNTAGAIKYDNVSSSPNRWHYGNVDGTVAGWKRMENAERRYSPENYAPSINSCQGASGQKIQGIWNGTTVTGNANTPFPTNTASNNRRGFRAQYIYPATELINSGLCQGLITKFSFYAISSDVGISAGPDGTFGTADDVPGADIKVDVRMGNSGLANFGPYVASQATALTVDWDNITEGSAQINATAATPILVSGGWMDFTLSGAGFNWNGVSNLIIDVSWVRNTTIGNSPPVQLETGLSYTATKWVQVTSGSDINHGNTYQDNPLTLNATTGTTQNRPVTRFFGKVQTPGYGAPVAGAFINYGGGMVIDTTLATPASADAIYRGPGTVVARKSVWDGNVALSDHVFDRYYDGQVAPEDAGKADGYAYIGVRELKNYLQENRHLPNMPSREQWEQSGSRSLGELQTGLWESVETQALHISELEHDLSSLEALAFGDPRSPDDLEKMIADVNASRRLSAQQKLHLTDALRQRFANRAETK